jgi:hypothetical protein
LPSDREYRNVSRTKRPGGGLTNTTVLKIPVKNRYGSVGHFRDYNGVVLIEFGDEDGVEPDKDALKFDKEDLPAVIAFLQAALERG